MATGRILFAVVSGLVSMLPAMGAPEGGSHELTPSAATALKNLYPRGQVLSVGVEREHGVLFYEVEVREGNAALEIEVTPDGDIGEIESRVMLTELPKPAMEGLRKWTAGASIGEVERHEVRGVPRDGRFVEVEPAIVFYEAKYEADGVRKEISVLQDGSRLPSAADDDREDADDNSSEDSASAGDD